MVMGSCCTGGLGSRAARGGVSGLLGAGGLGTSAGFAGSSLGEAAERGSDLGDAVVHIGDLKVVGTDSTEAALVMGMAVDEIALAWLTAGETRFASVGKPPIGCRSSKETFQKPCRMSRPEESKTNSVMRLDKLTP